MYLNVPLNYLNWVLTLTEYTFTKIYTFNSYTFFIKKQCVNFKVFVLTGLSYTYIYCLFVICSLRLKDTVQQVLIPSYRYRHIIVIYYSLNCPTKLYNIRSIRHKVCMTTFQIVFNLTLFIHT